VGKSEYLNFVNGEWVSSHTEDTYTVINPATGGKIAAVPQSDLQDTRAAIDAARAAFDEGKWPRMTPGDRAAALFKLANLIEADLDRLAPLESQNQGKTIKQARDGDLPFSVDNLRFMAGASRTLTGQASMEYAYGATSVIRREPIGVIGQITPWNYPFMMAIWKLAPALAAGNTAVLKPASLTPLTTLELGKLIEAAGIPAGTVNLITGPGAVVGNELASSDKVDMVSLTGDTATGKEIMKAATSNVKKLHLELGGKAPFVVFEDANIAAAAEGAVAASMVNGGQDCTQAARFIVQDKVYKKFQDKFLERLKTVRMGDPLQRSTDLGPLVSSKQREKVEDYVEIGSDEGAKLALGGKRPKGKGFDKGWYYEPTAFVDTDASRPRRGVRTRRERPEVLGRGGGDRGGERCRLRALFLRLDEGRAAGPSRRERAPLRRGRDQRASPDRERDAARRIQAERIRQRSVRLQPGRVHPDQACVHRPDGCRAEAVALHYVRRSDVRLGRGTFRRRPSARTTASAAPGPTTP